MTIFLNADVGEGLPSDAQLYPYLDQASIACGGHAGDLPSMQQAVSACLQHNVSIGAHPSYPDKENFGRISLPMSESGLIAILYAQIHSLDQVCKELQATMHYVKPHGALYNDMMVKPEIFDAVLMAVLSYPENLALMVSASLASQSYRDAAGKAGVQLVTEAFADRRYLAGGQLQSRREVGAVLQDSDEILAQAGNLVRRGAVITANGAPLSVAADSLCIHGDNPASVAVVAALSRQIHA